MQHGTRRRTSARGEPPHAIRCPIRRLRGNADAANFYSAPAPHKRRKAPAHSTFDFGCGFRVETDTAQKDGSLPHTSPPCAQPLLASCCPRSARANDNTACGLSATIQQKQGETTLPAFTLMDCGKFDRTNQPVNGIRRIQPRHAAL